MESLKTDVVVIGTGGAGMAATLTAAEGGARVVVFEKNHFPGGISNTAMEIAALESSIQRKANIPITRDEAFKIVMEHTHWQADARLVRAFIDKTASTIEWLQQQGVEFQDIPAYFICPEMQLVFHIIKREKKVEGVSYGSGTAALMIKALMAKAKEKGVDFHLSTPVKKIIKDGDRIGGVIAEDQSGETVQVNAEAVIIAAGGYSSNKEMLKKYGGFEVGRDIFIIHSLELAGDGIKMAWDVGAVPDRMAPQLRWHQPRPPYGQKGIMPAPLSEVQLFLTAGQPYLWINQQGERFLDEGITGNAIYVGNAIARQKNRIAYNIFDGDTKKHLEEVGLDWVWIGFPYTKIDNLDGQIKKARDKGNEDVFMADSLEELGKKIGVNPDVLRQTVNEYNAFCEKGHDDFFAKDPRYLRQVKVPKFYAFRNMPSAYGTVGGIQINHKAEVLNKEHEVIPGLYAAGDCANGILSYEYSLAYILRGFPLGFAVNSGRIAGDNALKYIGK